MTAVSPMLELTDLILEAGGNDLLNCLQCGTCSGVCPWPLVKEFSPRRLLRLAALGVEGYEQEDIWKCVSCRKCVSRCPAGIDVIEVMRSVRSVILEAGSIPRTYAPPLGSLRSDGNPWAGARKERVAWTEGLAVPQYAADTEYLQFTCCAQAYDPRYRKVGKALAALFHAASLSYGILGTQESCCGDQARRVGSAEVYDQLRQSNIQLLREYCVRRVIASSPHCLQVLGDDYAKDLPISVVHHTTLLAQLVTDGRLSPRRELPLKVAYHDPCYLGRYAGEYDAPREVLRAIPSLELTEMSRIRESSLCCGGGGGGIWMDIPVTERFGALRVFEAQQVGAQVIATACPYCISMLEDAVKATDVEEAIAVRDVAELLAESVLPDSTPPSTSA